MNSVWKISLFNSLCYTMGWFWCVFLGVYGHPILALVGAAVLIAAQLFYAKRQDLKLYVQDLLLVVFAIPAGVLLEMLLISLHLIRYNNSSDYFPPIWIVALYPLFVLLLNHSLAFIRRRSLLALLFGFLLAPLSYAAGSTLGGLSFPQPYIFTWVMIGIFWGGFLSLFCKIATIIEKASEETFNERRSEKVLQLLYDGECPICNREVCLLKDRGADRNLEFINIASIDYLASDHGNIDYEKAMSQMHAIEGDGQVLIGLPAFAAVYARSELLVISTLLRIPFVAAALSPLYTFFAKNRLWLTRR